MAYLNTPTDGAIRLSDPDKCAVRTVDATLVSVVRSALPPGPVIAELADVFGLLADPGRLRLLVALRAGQMCVCDLAAACGQSESSVSHALRLLRAHRIVQSRRAGRIVFYRLADDHVRELLALALTHQGHPQREQQQPR